MGLLICVFAPVPMVKTARFQEVLISEVSHSPPEGVQIWYPDFFFFFLINYSQKACLQTESELVRIQALQDFLQNRFKQ